MVRQTLGKEPPWEERQSLLFNQAEISLKSVMGSQIELIATHTDSNRKPEGNAYQNKD